MSLLDRLGCRGFTYLEKVQGRGSKTGDPHFGSHAWPSMCSAIITVVEDHKVDPLLDTLHKMDLGTEQLVCVRLYGTLSGLFDIRLLSVDQARINTDLSQIECNHCENLC